MQTLQFPMTLTHRDNPHAQVVVANAEQLAQMPEEYLPLTIGGTPAVVTAAAAIPGVNLDATRGATAEEAERRQSLEEAVDEFTAHVQAETAKIDAARAQLEQDRATLARERADFEAQKNLAQIPAADAAAPPADAGTPAAADPDAAAPPVAPAKRTRAAGKEGA